MNNTSEENNYKAMVINFRISDLQKLLKAFDKNITGRRFDLQNQALEILSSKPIGLNYEAFLIKILEIYNDQMRSSTQPQQTQTMYMNHNIHVPQQRTYAYINPIEAKYIPRNAMANNNIQCVLGSYPVIRPNNNIHHVPGSYQPIRPNYAVSSQIPLNQHNYMSNMVTENSMRFYLKTMKKQNIPIPLTPEIVAQCKFKKLPFYEVQEDIIKPTLLSGSEKCSLATVCKGNSIFYLYNQPF